LFPVARTISGVDPFAFEEMTGMNGGIKKIPDALSISLEDFSFFISYWG